MEEVLISMTQQTMAGSKSFVLMDSQRTTDKRFEKEVVTLAQDGTGILVA